MQQRLSRALSQQWRVLTRRFTLGARGERIAARFLKRHGYRILQRNLRTKIGEIDLLAQSPDGNQLVVVEVKTGSGGPIRPEVRVGHAKQRKLTSLASLIARHAARYHGRPRSIRFDVVGVDLTPRGKPVVRHHPNAFQSHL